MKNTRNTAIRITMAAILALCQYTFSSSTSEHKEWFKLISSLQARNDSTKSQYVQLSAACENTTLEYCNDSLNSKRQIYYRTNAIIDSIRDLRRHNPDSTALDSGKYSIYRLQPFIVRFAVSQSGMIGWVIEINGDSLNLYSMDSVQFGKKFVHRKIKIGQADINQVVGIINNDGILKLHRSYSNNEGDGTEVRLTISQSGSTKKVYTLNHESTEIQHLAESLIQMAKGAISTYPREIFSQQEQISFSKRIIDEFACSSCLPILDRRVFANTRTSGIASIKLSRTDTNKIEKISTISSSHFWDITSKFITPKKVDANDEYRVIAMAITIKRPPFKRYRFEISFKSKDKLTITNHAPIGSKNAWDAFSSKGGDYELPYEAILDIENMIANDSL